MADDIWARLDQLHQGINDLQTKVSKLSSSCLFSSSNLGRRQLAWQVERDVVPYVWPGAMGAPFYLQTWESLEVFLAKPAWHALSEDVRQGIVARREDLRRRFPMFGVAVRAFKAHYYDDVSSVEELRHYLQQHCPDDVALLDLLQDVARFVHKL